MRVKKLDPKAVVPTRAHDDDAGVDLYAFEDVPYKSYTRLMVPTRIAIEIPKGYVGLVRDRSSVAIQKRLKVTAGVIDAGYTGEVNIVLEELAGEYGCVQRGEKIAQILLIPIATPPIVVVESLTTETERKDKGFGSTGWGVRFPNDE